MPRTTGIAAMEELHVACLLTYSNHRAWLAWLQAVDD